MEPRLGHDFGHVRVHLNSQAESSAKAVGALAYTVGRDIVFAQGQFAPHTASGQRMLAHELAHSVQQSGGRYSVPAGGLHVGPQNDAFEHDAERISASVLSRPSSQAPARAAARAMPFDGHPTLQRQPSPHADAQKDERKKKEDAEKKQAPPPAKTPVTAPPAASKPDKKSGKALPCMPQAVSNAEYLKHGGPQNSFGVTSFPVPKTAPPPPDVVTKASGKDVILQSTSAAQIGCESFFVRADESFRRPMVPKNKDQVSDTCKYGTFRQYLMLKDGADKVQEAEKDHCRDLRFAYDTSVGHYAAVINNLAGSHYPSQQDAEDAISKRIGSTPDTWTAQYLALCEKTKLRDSSGWHTPPEKKGPAEGIRVEGGQCVTDQTTRIDDSVYPEVGGGQHPSSEIIK